jgi:hypothetical protein
MIILGIFSALGGLVFGWCGIIGGIFLTYTIVALLAGWSFGLSVSGPMSIFFIIGIVGLTYLRKMNER